MTIDRVTIGRNDPCYCGSGKKYKKCCMAADKAKERSRVAHGMAVKQLRMELLKYARDERFLEPFGVAIDLYWDGLYSADNMEEMAESEALRFFDWFIYDYQTPEHQRLIEQYRAEKFDDLSTAQQEVLEEWLGAGGASGYLLNSYEGSMLQVTEFFTGDDLEVYASGGRGNVEVGEVILGRVIKMRDRLQFSTTAAYLPKAEIGDIKETMAAAQSEYLTANPDASYTDFMRAEGHRVIHHALAEAKRVGRPPVARLDPDRDDGAMRASARMLARQLARRQRRR